MCPGLFSLDCLRRVIPRAKGLHQIYALPQNHSPLWCDATAPSVISLNYKEQISGMPFANNSSEGSATDNQDDPIAG